MLPEILLIATLCSVDHPKDCNVQVLDEWQTVQRNLSASPQSSMDMQADCFGAQYETDDTIDVTSFQCYKMVVDDVQGFTVQSLTDGSLITIFYSDFVGAYNGS